MNEKYADREKQSHKKQQEKEKRLATALRDNLFRRKAQARARTIGTSKNLKPK